MALADVAKAAGVDVQCINLIAKWEGCLKKVGPDRYAPYLCPARVATIGMGTTVWNKTGVPVRMTDSPISYAQAEEALAYDIGTKYAPAVDRLKLPFVHGNQRGACVSFAYNVGTGGFSKSTLRWLIANKQYARAADEFNRWTRGGGRVLPGLVSRRRDERRLFLSSGGTLGPANPSSPVLTPKEAQKEPVQGRRWWWPFGGSR